MAPKYNCTLLAVHDGEGWELNVIDENQDVVAILLYPKDWGEKTAKELNDAGFDVA